MLNFPFHHNCSTAPLGRRGLVNVGSPPTGSSAIAQDYILNGSTRARSIPSGFLGDLRTPTPS